MGSGLLKISAVIYLACLIVSCAGNPNGRSEPYSVTKRDTLIIRRVNESEYSLKSISYIWVYNKDTLGYYLSVSQSKFDSSINLAFRHQHPLLFKTALKKIKACFPKIKEDFAFRNVNSLFFEPPIYYNDLCNELSNDYLQKFGTKQVPYSKVSPFLMNTDLTAAINNIFINEDKRVSGYSIEKFHLLKKENFSSYLPASDYTSYPDFAIHGMGLSISLE